MSLVPFQQKFVRMQADLIVWAYANGYALTFGDAWRSTSPLKCPGCGEAHTYQDLLVANGFSKVPHSEHNDRLAVDYNVWKDGELLPSGDERYRPLGEYWESLGGRWGGRFHKPGVDPNSIGWDPGHFELKGD